MQRLAGVVHFLVDLQTKALRTVVIINKGGYRLSSQSISYTARRFHAKDLVLVNLHVSKVRERAKRRVSNATDSPS